MQTFIEKKIMCPYCGVFNSFTLDASNGSQSFYNDCSACCNAIHLNMIVNEQHDEIQLYIDADDEQLF
ncbi:CPXCG motif-containing cysteine-rich protein [Vibrio ostreicida]|uniref:CPXCG motif-containing cysteine-rich protein n=1 Tax=Vibrio ostreicida TaxID=526588 RepID=A0ABT8BUX4_9VIBR|nr:CPXCG motif-containing cysteine-rich protein [Vibrio ostreicida]MDN3609950.1 CPXCG motif-containing cysteine-rich protein [Vibrio ostreicida]NPD10378.1 CPXCG motif-containing cysteine-rich protein [Vibrio ostreicida]